MLFVYYSIFAGLDKKPLIIQYYDVNMNKGDAVMKEYLIGLQHIGIPTNDVEKTVGFYESLGLETYYRKTDGGHDVAFLRLGSFVVETYKGEPAKRTGAIDHITFDVTDVEKVFALAKSNGYKLLDEEIVSLDFFDKGVRFFMIEGPNRERVEFNQIV
jgi:catechol 2,3-dioxygenase-like lactoylglutathione lyase family enzyme